MNPISENSKSSSSPSTQIAQVYSIEEVSVTPFFITSTFRSIMDPTLSYNSSVVLANSFGVYISSDVVTPSADNSIPKLGGTFNGPKGASSTTTNTFQFSTPEGTFWCRYSTNDKFNGTKFIQNYVEINPLHFVITGYNCSYDYSTGLITVPENTSGSSRVVYIRFQYIMDTTSFDGAIDINNTYIYFCLGTQQA